MFSSADLTIFIDTAPEICNERIERRDSAQELFHNVEELRRVPRNYHEALAQPEVVGHLIQVNGGQSVNEVSDELLGSFLNWLKKTEARSLGRAVPA